MMNDLISRQAAIEQFRKSLCALEIESGREYGISFSGVKRILKSLPSAERKGKWIKYANMDSWRCSECMKDNCYAFSWNSKTGEYDELQDNFCPNCGARMEL